VTVSSAPAVLVARATVVGTTRLSPAFQRVWLASPAFADLADLGFDTRIKLVLPGPTGALPAVGGEDWYAAWLAMPEEERSPMRTYTVRDVVGAAEHVHLVVDLVVHDEEHADEAGPACRWALAAAPGDELVVVGPHRAGGSSYGGTEFDPAGRPELLLVADETALPAVARILADLPAGHTGHAFVEVPSEADLLELAPPEGIEVHWIFRGSAMHGRRLAAEVRRHLGLAAEPEPAAVAPAAIGEVEVWETVTHSASGEVLDDRPRRRGTDHEPPPTSSRGPADLYAWIAGESWAVRSLRRALVGELGLERSQVAFMGYWRRGVAMRS
jgi:NADPH-dependent ferric siderophore reductase